MSVPITAAERAAWEAAYAQAQRVAPGQWGMLVDPPNRPILCYYPTDDVASRRIVPPHLWALTAQVTAVNALPRLLAALTAHEAENALLLAEVRALRDEVVALRVANGQLCEDVANWHAARATHVTDLAAQYFAEGDGVQLGLPDPIAPQQLGLLP